jgi:hypothetical protein
VDPEHAPVGLLAPLLQVPDDSYAERAALSIARRNPTGTKPLLIIELLAGRHSPALDLVPEVAAILNLTEARLVLAVALPVALRTVDPYAPGLVLTASRSVSSVLANYPSLVDEVLATVASDPKSSSVVADLVILAIARNALLSWDRIPDLAAVLASTPDELAERCRPADNRYSTSDALSAPIRGPRARALSWARRARLRYVSGGFRVRLLAALVIDIAMIGLLSSVVTNLDALGTNIPELGLGEALTLAGLLIALHVFAVELASGVLPQGLVATVAWPVRLVSAYAVAALAVLGALIPQASTGLGPAAAALLLMHVPVVAQDFVAKSDMRRATRRVSRDRAHDAAQAGIRAGLAFRNRAEVNRVLSVTTRIRRASAEPVTRRRLTVVSGRSGYLSVNPAGLSDLEATLASSGESTLTTGRRPPSVALLTDPWREVSQGDLIAVIEVDEPEMITRLRRKLRESVRVVGEPVADRSREAIANLADVLNRQAGTDRIGSASTSAQVADLLVRFNSLGAAFAGSDAPSGYLENALPFNPEMEAVRGFESLWVRVLEDPDESQREVLRSHALRVASSVASYPFSLFCDFLIVRLDVVGRDTSTSAVHSCAALIVELAGAMADAGRHDSFFPARSAIERFLDRMAAEDPVPRTEELVRQRFEELLARGLVADYSLETNVERGCWKLVSLARAASSPRRKVRIGLGLAKVGAAALDSGRIALAVRIAFMVREAQLDLTSGRAMLANGSFGHRMTALSQMSGGLFGPDVGLSIGTFLDWAERTLDALPSSATLTRR